MKYITRIDCDNDFDVIVCTHTRRYWTILNYTTEGSLLFFLILSRRDDLQVQPIFSKNLYQPTYMV